MKTLRAALLGFSMLGALASPAFAQSASRADYRFVDDLKLGGVGFGDYLTVDSASHRLYVSHFDQVTVVDTASGAVAGSIGPFKEAHGVAIVSRLGKGYASDGEDGVLKVFTLSDLKVVKEIKIDDDVDGITFDPSTETVLAVAGDPKTLSLVAVANDTVRKVALPGKPEFLAANGRGKVFINLADIGAITKIDIASGAIEATWPLENCKNPHGLAYDSGRDRLFASCSNGWMVAVDPSTGHNLANLPIGQGSDAVVVDIKRGLVFSSNADGTLSVVREGSGDSFSLARTFPTFFGGRNMAIDGQTGDLYVAHGNTVLVGGHADLKALRFGWDGLNVAKFVVEP